MSCEHAPIRLGDKRILRFKCEGCESGASVEYSEACMRWVVRALTKSPDVNSVILANIYEHEYSGSSLAELKEVAKIFKANAWWLSVGLAPTDCKRCDPERKQKLESLLNTLLGDPARAGKELESIIRELRFDRGAENCKKCRKNFYERVLSPILSSLENTKFAKIERMGREGYAKAIQTLTRPCFLSSRIELEPPAGTNLVDAYKVGGSEVRIYSLSDGLQHFYLLIPPGHRLSHDQVWLLYRARQSLLHQSLDIELDPLLARKQLVRLCASLMMKLVAEEKLDVGKEEIEELAQHLVRLTAGLGVLEFLLEDAKVQDIYIDSPVGQIPVHIYHQDFEECLTNIRLTPEDAESLVSRFRAFSGRPFSEADPVLDLNLGGVRVAAIGHPLSPDGLAFALRRHKPTPWTFPQFIRARFLTPYAAGLLSLLVDSQVSLPW